MAQLTAAYQADNPEFLLEGAGQVAVEEVVSEEVVTDEPMVVIETEDASTTTVTAMGTNEDAPSISDAITITMTDTQPITSTITTSVTDNGQSVHDCSSLRCSVSQSTVGIISTLNLDIFVKNLSFVVYGNYKH